MNRTLKNLTWQLSLGALILAAGCDREENKGTIGLTLYDEPVICHEQLGRCLSPTQAAVPSESVTSQVYLSRAVSQYGLGGLYIYFELRRANGAVAVVELDVPTSSRAGGSAREPATLYKEFKDGKRVFHSTQARGRMELPASGACPCQDGLLELVFTDPGPDKVVGTPDDAVRRLSKGAFGLATTSCRYARLINVEHQASLEVIGLRHCPGAGSNSSSSSSGGSAGYYHDDNWNPGCYGYPMADEDYRDDYQTEEEGGCGGDDSDYAETEDQGCEGDSWDSGDSSSDSGCEGDSGSSSDFGDGCEGDTSSPSSNFGEGCGGDTSSSADMSCEGDSWAAAGKLRRKRRRPPPLWRQAVGMLPPVIMLGLVHAFFRRRRRR